MNGGEERREGKRGEERGDGAGKVCYFMLLTGGVSEFREGVRTSVFTSCKISRERTE
jgi:hypothetical protein